MLVKQENGMIHNDWYHKETWSGRYCNFHSYLPYQYKINTITMLTRKAMELSHESFLEKNFELIKNVLSQNNYPPFLIKKVMENTIEKYLFPSNEPETAPMPVKFMSIPYEHVPFGKIKALLAPYNIRIVGCPQKTLGSLLYTKLKDKVDKKYVSDVVYEITCECSLRYIGQTKQHLYKRFKQHSRGNSEHSALSSHLIDSGHSIKFENVKVLCSERQQNKRDIKEMIYIRSNHCMNTQLDHTKLSKCYDYLLSVD